METQIDLIFYQLNQLNYEEVKVIDPHFSLTEEEYNAITLE
jgi:heat shock protein HspQ